MTLPDLMNLKMSDIKLLELNEFNLTVMATILAVSLVGAYYGVKKFIKEIRENEAREKAELAEIVQKRLKNEEADRQENINYYS